MKKSNIKQWGIIILIALGFSLLIHRFILPKIIEKTPGVAAISIKEREIKEAHPELEMELTIPYVEGLQDEHVQEKINAALEQPIIRAKTYMEQISVDAKEGDFPFDRPYHLQATYKVTYQQKDLLSVVISLYEYTGGAHGIPVQYAFTFNLTTGDPLTLKDLFQAEAPYIEAIDHYIEKTIEAAPEDDYFEGEFGFQGIHSEHPFYLTQGAVVIFFTPYEIAPYSTGIPEFHIPIEGLKDYLSIEL